MDGLQGCVDRRARHRDTGLCRLSAHRYPVAGKTGTAQATPKQDPALFVALAPADEPRYAVAVVMEQAGYGSTSAAPVARRIIGELSGIEAPAPVDLVDCTQG